MDKFDFFFENLVDPNIVDPDREYLLPPWLTRNPDTKLLAGYNNNNKEFRNRDMPSYWSGPPVAHL